MDQNLKNWIEFFACLLFLLAISATLSWQSVGLAIERLLTPGSIPELAMGFCVLGKDTLPRISRLEPSRLYVVVAQPDKNFQTEPKKECCSLLRLDRRRGHGSYERKNGCHAAARVHLININVCTFC